MARTPFQSAVVVMTLTLAVASLGQGRPAGQLMDVRGKVEIQRTRGAALRGNLLFPLQTGDVISVAAGGAAEVVLFAGGARYSVPAGSKVRVEGASLKGVSGPAPRALKAVASLPSAGAKPSGKILGLVVRDNGKEETLGPRQPAPNGAVREERVVLRWFGPVEAKEQELRVQTADDDPKTVFTTTLPEKVREFLLPTGKVEPGKFYMWTVSGISDSGDTHGKCSALLRILPPAERTALDQVEREAEAALKAEPRNPVPYLLRAQTYEQVGMFSEAKRDYEAALKLRPNDEGIRSALKNLSGK